MEKADSKDDLPPLTPQNMVLKEIDGDLCEGTSHVGSQAFRWLISYLATTTGRQTGLIAVTEKTTIKSAVPKKTVPHCCAGSPSMMIYLHSPHTFELLMYSRQN